MKALPQLFQLKQRTLIKCSRILFPELPLLYQLTSKKYKCQIGSHSFPTYELIKVSVLNHKEVLCYYGGWPVLLPGDADGHVLHSKSDQWSPSLGPVLWKTFLIIKYVFRSQFPSLLHTCHSPSQQIGEQIQGFLFYIYLFHGVRDGLQDLTHERSVCILLSLFPSHCGYRFTSQNTSYGVGRSATQYYLIGNSFDSTEPCFSSIKQG